MLGGDATVGGAWSVRGPAEGAAVTCASRVSEPAGSSYDSLVDAHQRALGKVADQLAVAIRSLAAGQAATCAL